MKLNLSLLAIAAFLSYCTSKPIKEYLVANQDNSPAKYIKIGNIQSGRGLQAFKLTVDSIDYIVISRDNGGTAIIKHGK